MFEDILEDGSKIALGLSWTIQNHEDLSGMLLLAAQSTITVGIA